MEITIDERKENPLLKREEITFTITHEGENTPSREVVASKLAAMINADKDRTILKKISTQFGVHEAVGYANLYPSKEDALEIEAKHILIRNGLIEGESK
ncbi:MAG: 30S ribosomal protein S24e [Candidatus Heimdallarchaeota archaeon]|nr:30S ribosomal protein S24e [Candidatus Heimdallarchaeota archaeon]